MVVLMKAILTQGASCQQKDSVTISVPMSGRRTPGARKDCSLNAWVLEENKMQVPSASGLTTICRCADTIVTKLAVALASIPLMRVYWTVFVAATSGVFPDNEEREDRVFDLEAGEVGKDSTSLSGKWAGGQGSQSSVKQVACTYAMLVPS